MPRTRIKNTERNIFFKDNNNNVYICCITNDADKRNIEDTIENKKEYYQVIELRKYIIKIYNISNNNVISVIELPIKLLSKGGYKIFTPSEYELNLYEALYKDLKKTIKYEKEKEIIQKIINNYMPLIYLLDDVKKCYHTYKDDLSNFIKSLFKKLFDSSNSAVDEFNIRQKLNYFKYYEYIQVDNNLEERVTNDAFQHIINSHHITFNHYHSYKGEIILIMEKPFYFSNQINLFAEFRLHASGKKIRINNAIIIDEKNDENIIEILRNFVNKRSIFESENNNV
jgi:hypothetical protein